MSLDVILFPHGFAAFKADWGIGNDVSKGCKATRITDVTLLVQVLEEMGAEDITSDEATITARSRHGSLFFQNVDGIFLGRVDEADEAQTDAMLSDLDTAAGIFAQRKSLMELRTRAAQLGLREIGEEIAEDGTVRLVFEEVN